MPNLIELGLDALNAQIFCTGPEKLGQQFKVILFEKRMS